jgi:hypothetical protein
MLVLLLQQPNELFTGPWVGNVANGRTILLNITNSSGSVEGRVVFFSQSDHSQSVQMLSDATIAGNKLSFKLPKPNAETTFEFVQTSPTRGKLTGTRAGEHIEIVLTKGKWTEGRRF